MTASPTDGHEGGSDDPFVALAQIRARRAMADLAGFEHHPSWDAIEADALARLGGREPGAPAPDEPAATAPAPAPPRPTLDDPLLALAQVKAFRLAADSLGVAHDPSWDATEADVGDQLHRDQSHRDVRPESGQAPGAG